jgi:hypothetical protein
MTTEERISIIHRLWTFEETTVAGQCLRNLSNNGTWGDLPPTPAMMEFATAKFREVGLLP